MAMGAGLLCLINTYVVGNNTEVRSAIMTASFFVAALMLDEEVDERTYLVAMYLNDILCCYDISPEEFSRAYYGKMQRNLHRDWQAEHTERYGV